MIKTGGKGFDQFDISFEDLKTLEENKRGGNSKEHIARQEAMEVKFFSTIETCGGTVLAPLLVICLSKCSSGAIEDRAFCDIVGGAKSEIKRSVLNACLCLCGLKWVVDFEVTKNTTH